MREKIENEILKIKKPNVVVAGFGRCGTTFLSNILKQHPDVFIPKVKEINYFAENWYSSRRCRNPTHQFGDKWYLNFFRTDKKIVIDFSVWDAYDPISARNTKRLLPDAKIIFMIRDKDKHDYSLYKGRLSNSQISNISFEKYKKIKKYEYKKLSDYEKMIEPYRKLFDDILVVKLEELTKNTEKELKRIFKFLGLKEMNLNSKVFRKPTVVGKYSYVRRLRMLIVKILADMGILYVIHKLRWNFQTSTLRKVEEYEKVLEGS